MVYYKDFPETSGSLDSLPIRSNFDFLKVGLDVHTSSSANPHSVSLQQATNVGATTTNPITVSVSGSVLKSLRVQNNELVGGSLEVKGNIKTNQMELEPAPITDHTASGLIIKLTASVNLAFGDVGYLASTGKVLLGDADAIATSSCIVMCADSSISQNAIGNFLLHGIARDDTWNWTVGGLIYLSTTGTTGNTLTQTAPSGTDDVIQIIGVATHADRIYFNPQLVQVEHV